MYRIDNSTASSTLPPQKPVGTPGFFTTGTVGGQPATIVEADWLNTVQEEILAVLQAGAINPNKSDRTQLIQAILALINGHTRLRLAGPLNLYVAPGGSDTNNGLSPSTAFATPQAAWNYIMARLDLGGNNVYVNLADGSYPALVCAGCPVGTANNAAVYFQGDQVSPSSVVISQPNGVAVNILLGAAVVLSGLRVQAAGTGGDYNGNGQGIVVNSGGACIFSNIDFGTCQTGHMLAISGGSISTGGAPYSISGNAPTHAQASFSGGGLSLANSHVTLYNNPTFATAFVAAIECGTMNVWGMQFTGGATGKRWIAAQNGVIVCYTNPDTYFPGTVAGTASSGGQVV